MDGINTLQTKNPSRHGAKPAIVFRNIHDEKFARNCTSLAPTCAWSLDNPLRYYEALKVLKNARN